MAEVTPMFPLGTVLLPGMPLPLHVFEPRYRELVQRCLDGTPEFGVVLIARGSEVGGGDQRTDVGTVARIVEAARFDDGRYAIGAVGVRRIRIRRWLPDDPYPQAEVDDWPDESGSVSGADVEPVAASFRRVLGLAAELGMAVAPATLDLPVDPDLAVAGMAGAAPLGPADRYDLLVAAGTVERLALLARLLEDQAELLEGQLRLAAGGPHDGEGSGEGSEDL